MQDKLEARQGSISWLQPVAHGHFKWIFENYAKKNNWKKLQKKINETKCKEMEEKQIKGWLVHILLLND
jgi:hypothetical protein